MDSLDIIDVLSEAIDFALENDQVLRSEYDAAMLWLERQADS